MAVRGWVSWAQSVAVVRFLGDLWVPWSVLFPFFLWSASALIGDCGSALGGVVWGLAPSRAPTKGARAKPRIEVDADGAGPPLPTGAIDSTATKGVGGARPGDVA